MQDNSPTEPSPWNVPNALSSLRLILAIVVCILIERHEFFWAMISFVVAASTDWMDGYWARKYKQVTKLGRILDPFVDKIIICGAMIALVGVPAAQFPSWIATLVVGREMLVTSLRGMIEGRGGDFSAKDLGKWKMVAQCTAVVAILVGLQWMPSPLGLVWVIRLSVWAAVALTVISGLQYVLIAVRLSSANQHSKPTHES